MKHYNTYPSIKTIHIHIVEFTALSMPGGSSDILKLVVLGDTTVGKTCVVTREVTNSYNEKGMPTLGASFHSKSIRVNDRNVMMQIWDTAGQERYRAMTPMYYQGAHVVLIIYSITSKASFDAVDKWISELTEKSTTSSVILLIGNKADLELERQVTAVQGAQKAKDCGAIFMEVSAKTGDGIKEIFSVAAKAFIDKNPITIEQPARPIRGNLVHEEPKESNCC